MRTISVIYILGFIIRVSGGYIDEIYLLSTAQAVPFLAKGNHF